jgi:hypothetical protein
MAQQRLSKEQIEMFDTITSKVMYCELEYIRDNYTALMEYKRQKEIEYRVECYTLDENGGIKEMVYWNNSDGYSDEDDARHFWRRAVMSGRYDTVRLTNIYGDIEDEWNKSTDKEWVEECLNRKDIPCYYSNDKKPHYCGLNCTQQEIDYDEETDKQTLVWVCFECNNI